MKIKKPRPIRKSLRNLWNVLLASWRPTLGAVFVLALVIGLMGWKLNTLTPGLSEPEVMTYQSANRLSAIVDNSVNAPYKFAVFLSTRMLDSTLGLRVVGAIVGIVTILMFYWLAQRILNSFNASLTTAMFATSTLFLQTTRHAETNVMLLMLFILVAVGAFIRFGKKPEIGWITASVAIGLSLYVPALIYFVLAGAAWQFRHVRHSFENLESKYIIICAAIFSVLATPLVVSLIREPSLYDQFLGIPEVWPSWVEAGKRAGRSFLSLFVYSQQDPVHWLGRQPIIGVFGTALFIYGISKLVKGFRLDRFLAILGIILLTFVWIAISGNQQAIIMVLPFIYLIIGFGLENLLGKWFGVFPRNPIARSVGMSLMLVAAALAVNFQLQRYFRAWPNAPATKEAYSHHLK